eukprot:CAMPEP_0168621526 /NCGR_PEP_ID=MMETSP0449_2-20121227/7743_1 /TAXON_ID=1082188 /ORGANISM="Strombidium rassoulzadegani, Strain ras09" /LENGTH=294 /DNA_ID=CAMNT_0008662655 /DNA_START=470 /DNA_END=1351 /DNA_ORIENTATION=+
MAESLAFGEQDQLKRMPSCLDHNILPCLGSSELRHYELADPAVDLKCLEDTKVKVSQQLRCKIVGLALGLVHVLKPVEHQALDLVPVLTEKGVQLISIVLPAVVVFGAEDVEPDGNEEIAIIVRTEHLFAVGEGLQAILHLLLSSTVRQDVLSWTYEELRLYVSQYKVHKLLGSDLDSAVVDFEHWLLQFCVVLNPKLLLKVSVRHLIQVLLDWEGGEEALLRRAHLKEVGLAVFLRELGLEVLNDLVELVNLGEVHGVGDVRLVEDAHIGLDHVAVAAVHRGNEMLQFSLHFL